MTSTGGPWIGCWTRVPEPAGKRPIPPTSGGIGAVGPSAGHSDSVGGVELSPCDGPVGPVPAGPVEACVVGAGVDLAWAAWASLYCATFALASRPFWYQPAVIWAAVCWPPSPKARPPA